MIIRNDRGEKFTPSVVTFLSDGNVAVGTPAIVQAFSNPNRVFYNVKRKLEDETDFVYKNQKYTYINIASKIFESLKNSAKKYRNNEKIQAVLCTPAYFTTTQKSAIAAAAKQAGFEILRMIPEPVSAALAYGVEKNDKVVICDLGGGTFDVSILQIGEGVAQVRAINGDNSLGGIDFDNRIVEFVISDFFDKYGIDLSNDKIARIRLLEAAEQAKIALSELDKTTVFVPNIYADHRGVKSVNVVLSRDYFEKITIDLVDTIEECCRAVLADIWIKDIDKILLVGLSTQIPAVKDRIQSVFKMPVDPNIDPNDAVAIGAAIQAGVLSGNVNDVLLLDVVPLTLSLETLGGVASPIINRNTTIPARKTKVFSTVNDNQTVAEFHIVQGERPMAVDNLSLGGFYFDGIPPNSRGVPQIEVTFDINVNGLLQVIVKEKTTGKEKRVEITPSNDKSGFVRGQHANIIQYSYEANRSDD